MPVRAMRAVAYLAVATVAVVGAACGNDEEAAPAGTAPETTTSSERATTTTHRPAHQLTASVEAGEVEGGARRERIEVGELVDITVTSDADDTLHVHGYDLTAEVKAGIPSGLSFSADIPGVFEVELEDSGLKLLELEVR